MAGARKASADIAPRSAEAASVVGESIVLVFTESAFKYEAFLSVTTFQARGEARASRRHKANSSLSVWRSLAPTPDL